MPRKASAAEPPAAEVAPAERQLYFGARHCVPAGALRKHRSFRVPMAHSMALQRLHLPGLMLVAPTHAAAQLRSQGRAATRGWRRSAWPVRAAPQGRIMAGQHGMDMVMMTHAVVRQGEGEWRAQYGSER